MQNVHSTPVAPKQMLQTTSHVVHMNHMNCSCMSMTPDSLKKNIPMTPYANGKLTEENFGPLPSSESKFGGFYFSRSVELSHVDSLRRYITDLAQLTKRRFRLGTSFELLLYVQLGLACPTRFISLEKNSDSEILFWCDYDFGTMFHLYPPSQKLFRPDCGIFIIEE